MRMRTRSAMAALPLLLTLALTGCGMFGGDDDGGGKGGAATPGAGGAAAGAKGNNEMGVKFAQCMRENGVQMEDPKPGQGVLLKGKGIDRATMEKAQEACRKFSPEANGAMRSNPEQEARIAKFAKCMRDNGVDFPDPEPGQRGIKIDESIAEDPDFKKADEECQPLMRGGAKGGGTPQ